MATTAVTQGSSAGPDRSPASQFLPTDKNYRLTGELPDELETAATQNDQDEYVPQVLKEERERPVKEESSASSESESAAAPEAAPVEEKGPERTKTAATSESRWAKLSRENRELREWKAQREREEAERTQPQREAKQVSQPAAETADKKPTLDDLDENGQPKFKTLAEFQDARDEWLLKDFQRRQLQTERERQQQQAEQAIYKTVNERIATARQSYPDYDEVMADVQSAKDDFGRDAFFFPPGSHIDGFFLESDRMSDLMYHIAKNFGDYQHIFARDQAGNYLMNPVRQLRELARIENSLDAKTEAPPPPKVTKAPPPPRQVSTKGAVGKEATEQAVEDGDFEAYARAQNAKALARLHKGK